MSDYEFTLPFPPSVNAWKTPFRGRMILTKKGREYRMAAINLDLGAQCAYYYLKR